MIFKKPKSKLQKAVSRAFLIIFGAVLVGGILYITVYRPLQISNEKKNFEKARQSIEDLYAKIEAKIGKPNQIKHEQSCGYSSSFNEFYPKGDRSCSVNIYALYENRDKKTSSVLMKTSADIVGTTLVTSLTETQFNNQRLKEFVSIDRYNDQTFSQNIEINPGHLSCSISYKYPVYPTYSTIDVLLTNTKENFQLHIYCSGDAKTEHYPVKNN